MKIRNCDQSSGDQNNGRNQDFDNRETRYSFINIRARNQSKCLPLPIRIALKQVTNQAGYNLTEVLVAAAIMSFALVSIWYMMTLVQSQFSSLQNKVQTEVEINQMMFTVNHFLAMGINVTASSHPLNITSFNSPYGQLVSAYNLNSWTPTTGSGAVDTIAFFLRDNLQSRYTGPAPANAARFLPTAIFFQRPTVDKYGVLYISTRETGGTITAAANDYMFEGIVDFRVRDVNFLPFDKNDDNAIDRYMVFSATFDITQRHFLPDTTGSPLRWCPPSKMGLPECIDSRIYFDLVKTFTVKIRNNVIGKSRFQRVRSGVNYPPIEKRVFENTYFLRPTYPPEALKR